MKRVYYIQSINHVIFSFQIGRGRNDVRLLNSAVINDYTMLTYRQPLKAKERKLDTRILTNGTQVSEGMKWNRCKLIQ